VSGLPFLIHHDDVEESSRRQLLALCRVRRGVERRPPPGHRQEIEYMEVDRTELARELRELIDALDRRVPHVEKAGEESIARDAAALREKAMKRLAELAADDR
jgi:hypothetical protein